MVRLINVPNPPNYSGSPPKPPGSTAPTSVSPGLITSTGGITGATGALLEALLDTLTGAIYLGIWDPTIFDTEEDCIYNFPQENVKVNYDVSSYKLILMYRNIGKCTVTFNLTCFRKGLTTYSNNQAIIQQGKFYTISKTMILGTTPPDNLIYTLDVNIKNPGQRPQLSMIRKANKGPFSLVSIGLYGNADEQEKL